MGGPIVFLDTCTVFSLKVFIEVSILFKNLVAWYNIIGRSLTMVVITSFGIGYSLSL
ncbi:MAG: hypothetical protein IPF93_13385 [Saprospiraceae bacterium]|nr:hypothetical protein [Saprospiraceae bacterium]MBL0111304.1 hypothetical protein [Saprospiraceae bacterium]